MIGRLALAYARRRPLATILVVLLLSLGVAIVTLTLLVTHEIEARLTRDAEGIDLVVGAKGSPLQLVLAGVYHADVPPGNIPLSSLADLRAHPQISEVIPLALGDSVHGYRIVGTEPSLVAHYHGVPARGALWTKPMDAVLGSDVARATGLDVGATFTGSHGLADGGGEHAGQPYSVVGVLAATGTVLDRLVLTPLESVWNVHEHHSADRHDDDQAAGKPRRELETAARREEGPDDNWLVRKDGSRFWASGATSALRDEKGRLRAFTKVIRDTTDRKRAAEALAQSHVELQAHAEELARFNSAAVGRELRMIDLKKEINELCERQGEPARYPLDFEEGS